MRKGAEKKKKKKKKKPKPRGEKLKRRKQTNILNERRKKKQLIRDRVIPEEEEQQGQISASLSQFLSPIWEQNRRQYTGKSQKITHTPRVIYYRKIKPAMGWVVYGPQCEKLLHGNVHKGKKTIEEGTCPIVGKGGLAEGKKARQNK